MLTFSVYLIIRTRTPPLPGKSIFWIYRFREARRPNSENENPSGKVGCAETLVGEAGPILSFFTPYISYFALNGILTSPDVSRGELYAYWGPCLNWSKSLDFYASLDWFSEMVEMSCIGF